MSNYDRATALYYKIESLQKQAIEANDITRFCQLHTRAMNLISYRANIIRQETEATYANCN